MHTAIADRKERFVGFCRCYGVVRLDSLVSTERVMDSDSKTGIADFLVDSDLEKDGLCNSCPYAAFDRSREPARVS